MFARVVDNVAVDVSVDPADQYHPDIVAQFESVPESVSRGWRLIDGVWTAPSDSFNPAAQPEAERVYPVLSPVEFKLLFTSEERIKLYELRNADPVLNDFLLILDDARLTEVRLERPSVQRGLDLCLALLLTAGVISDQTAADQRKADILEGVAQ